MRFRIFLPLLIFLLVATSTGSALDVDQRTFLDMRYKAAQIPDPESVEKLAASILEKSKSQKESITLAYVWIAENISYDIGSYLQGKESFSRPDQVLKHKTAVCEGYSALFHELARLLNIPSEIIRGYSRGYGYELGFAPPKEPDHSWNAIQIDEKWYLVDVTWGSGYVENGKFVKKIERFYLDPKPEYFIFDHFPENEKWQLLEEKINLQDFYNLPQIRPGFFYAGLKIDYRKTAGFLQGLKSVYDPGLAFEAEPDTLISAQLINGMDIISQRTFVQRSGNRLEVLIRFPHKGIFKLRIFARKSGSLEKKYNWAADFLVEASGGSESVYPESISHLEYNVIPIAPREGRLASGREYSFEIQSAGAESVAIKSGEDWKLLEKDQVRFRGRVRIKKGANTVFIRPYGSPHYIGVLEYRGL